MGFFAKLVGFGVGESASKIANVVDKFVETPDERRAAEVVKMKILQNADQWQTEINKIEASHRNFFIAGWRPAIGWICATALAWGWVIGPIVETILILCKVEVQLPKIQVAEALGLATIMLGNAALRSYEKGKGVSK